jgi:hypothetical protein
MTSLADDVSIRARVTALLDAVDVTEPFDLVDATNDVIGGSMRRLLQHPGRWARLVADPALIPAVVDEVWATAPERLEARIALEELARRAPTLRLYSPGPQGELWVELT